MLHLASGRDELAFQTSERAKFRTLAELLAQSTQKANAGSFTSVSLASLCTKLPTETLAISYAIVHESVYAFLMDRQGPVGPSVLLGPRLLLTELNKGMRQITSVAHWTSMISAETLRRHIATAQLSLMQLYDRFLAPLSMYLERYPNLIIAPDGLLNLMPFACLFNATNSKYLAQTHTLTIVPSLSTWVLIGQQANQNTKARRTPRSIESLVVGCSSGGKLMGAVTEAESVSNQIGQYFAKPTLLLEDEAQYERVLQAAPNADLIYLATHGVYRPDAPIFSCIELHDRTLEAADVVNLNLRAQAIILSACETGIGHLTGNEIMVCSGPFCMLMHPQWLPHAGR